VSETGGEAVEGRGLRCALGVWWGNRCDEYRWNRCNASKEEKRESKDGLVPKLP
jgi:hypothetical protein